MKYLEFKSIFTEPEAPKDLKSLVLMESIDLIEINTAGDDTDNTGDYCVWLTFTSGNTIPCFRGTKVECIQHYEQLRQDILSGDSELRAQ